MRVHRPQIVVDLKKYYGTADQEEFLDHFKQFTNHVLVVFKREPAVERVVQFMVRFVAGADGEFLNAYIQYLLDFHGAKVRRRAFIGVHWRVGVSMCWRIGRRGA